MVRAYLSDYLFIIPRLRVGACQSYKWRIIRCSILLFYCYAKLSGKVKVDYLNERGDKNDRAHTGARRAVPLHNQDREL